MTTNAVYETIDLINDLSAACTNYWNDEQAHELEEWVAELLIGHIEQHHPSVEEHFKKKRE